MDYTVIKQCLKKLKFSSHAKTEMLAEEFGMIKEGEVNSRRSHFAPLAFAGGA